MSRIKIFIIRKLIFGILLSAISVSAQGTIAPLIKDGWVGGLSGSLGWDKYTINAGDGNINIDSKVDGFGFIISSRNGKFVENNSVIGFDFQWEENKLTTTPENNVGNEFFNKTRLGFIGLWIRYYVSFIGTGWALYPEVSVGYGNYKLIQKGWELSPEYSSMVFTFQNNEAMADGFVYNAGVGATIFVSNNVAFEATGRYQGGNLKGEYKYSSERLNNLEVKLSNIDVLFGIMVYLR